MLKKNIYTISICLLLFMILSCDGSGTTSSNNTEENSSEEGLSFEMCRLGDGVSGTDRSLSRNYLPANGGGWFTPDSFIIKVGTIAINDEEGNFLELFDTEDDSQCITLDLGKGERLSEYLEINDTYRGECIAWIAFAVLPEIDYSYTDNSGTVHSGTIDLPVEGGGGFSFEIGTARGRVCFGIDNYEPDYGWGDTRFFFNEGEQNLIMYFDLDHIIYDPDEDGTPESIEYEKAFFAVSDSCEVHYYYFKNASGSEEIYPYRLTMIESKGLPVYGKVFARDMESSVTSDYNVPEFFSMNTDDHSDRDNCLTINDDGSYDIILGNGSVIPSLKKLENQSITVGLTTVTSKYKQVY